MRIKIKVSSWLPHISSSSSSSIFFFIPADIHVSSDDDGLNEQENDHLGRQNRLCHYQERKISKKTTFKKTSY